MTNITSQRRRKVNFKIKNKYNIGSAEDKELPQLRWSWRTNEAEAQVTVLNNEVCGNKMKFLIEQSLILEILIT